MFGSFLVKSQKLVSTLYDLTKKDVPHVFADFERENIFENYIFCAVSMTKRYIWFYRQITKFTLDPFWFDERNKFKQFFFWLKLRQNGNVIWQFSRHITKLLHFVIWRKKQVLFCWNYNWLIFTGMRKKNVKRNCVDCVKTNNAWLWLNAAVGVWCNGVAPCVGVWFEAVAGLCSVGVALNDLFRVIRVPGLHFNTAMAPLFATFAKRASVMAMTW